jgi:hypothetical protein
MVGFPTRFLPGPMKTTTSWTSHSREALSECDVQSMLRGLFEASLHEPERGDSGPPAARRRDLERLGGPRLRALQWLGRGRLLSRPRVPEPGEGAAGRPQVTRESRVLNLKYLPSRAFAC